MCICVVTPEGEPIGLKGTLEDQKNEDRKKELKRARNKVIDQHLVQQPATVFGVCGRLGQILVATFVFVDLEFDVGPVILYSLLFIAAELGFQYWHNRSESPEVAAAL